MDRLSHCERPVLCALCGLCVEELVGFILLTQRSLRPQRKGNHVGFLINFHARKLADAVTRIVNDRYSAPSAGSVLKT